MTEKPTPEMDAAYLDGLKNALQAIREVKIVASNLAFGPLLDMAQDLEADEVIERMNSATEWIKEDT